MTTPDSKYQFLIKQAKMWILPGFNIKVCDKTFTRING